jgi:beta-glucosidase
MKQQDSIQDNTDTEARITVLVDALTVPELVALMSGENFWTAVPIPRLRIPSLKMPDGPNGARGGGAFVGEVKAACFPAGIALGSTWNTALVQEIGQAIAQEALSKGARVLLAPTVNLHRSTRNGRNFECYSEDPFLAAQMAVAYFRGVQSQGVVAAIKHFAGNESEFERRTINSEIGERALRELYLVPFEAAVKEAHVWAVMAAYNKLNGKYACENPRLLQEILKDEWQFDGVAMSDWYGTESTIASANHGLDLEMPGPGKFLCARLLEVVYAGEVNPCAIRSSARRLLRLIDRVGALRDPTIAEEQALDRPEHRALIRRAGAESIVLLKNDGVLPLDETVLHTIALIGPNAMTAQIMGGGSAQLNSHYRVSPYEGIAARVGERVELAHEVGCTNYRMLPLLHQTFKVEYLHSLDLSGEVIARAEAKESEWMWLDHVAPGVNPRQFSARVSTRFLPPTDGKYEFSLTSAGLSRLFVNDRLLIDNWSAWQPGDTHFGMGSDEQVVPLEMQAGVTYDLLVEFSSQHSGYMDQTALRIGGWKPLGEENIGRAAKLAAESDVAVLFVGSNGERDTEGRDRPDTDLVGRQNELADRVAAANPRTIVVLQTGAPVTMPWLHRIPAVMQAWYPGQECGNSIADVLFGAVNPSGRLPQTFPRRLEDDLTFVNYPGENGKVVYGEGIFIGYRYYDKKKIEPLYGFGHG